MTRLLSTLLAAFGVLALMLAGCNTQGESETTEPAEGEEMTVETSDSEEAAVEAKVEAPAEAEAAVEAK